MPELKQKLKAVTGSKTAARQPTYQVPLHKSENGPPSEYIHP